MFDIGFFELLLISIVGLLVFGPDQFLDAVRVTTRWMKRLRRSFDEVRTEIQRELHNDEVMRDLKSSATEFEKEMKGLTEPLQNQLDEIKDSIDAPEEDKHADSAGAAPQGHGTTGEVKS